MECTIVILELIQKEQINASKGTVMAKNTKLNKKKKLLKVRSSFNTNTNANANCRKCFTLDCNFLFLAAAKLPFWVNLQCFSKTALHCHSDVRLYFHMCCI